MHNRQVLEQGLPVARWRLLGQIGLLALAYFASAKLSLFFAIPPGYATPVWPPSGIALAALLAGGSRLWPGVWIGSAAVNLTIEASVAASAIIATRSTLQAVVAAAIIRRSVGVPYRFAQVQHVVKFVALAAGCATLAPTIVVPLLALLHPLPARELFWNWWTWA